MDLRDATHTQLKDHIATLRVIARQKPPSQLVWDEITRWAEQSATMLDIFVLSTIKEETPYLDLRTGTLGNSFNKTAELVGIAGKEEVIEPDVPGFLNPGKP